MVRRKPVDYEHREQVALFQWANIKGIGMLFAIPNGGHRHKATAAKLKAEGVKPGIPDICLAIAKGEYHGLFIEMKRRKEDGKSAVSPKQRAWITALNLNGYQAAVCYGWLEAKEVIEEYLKIKGW